MRRARHPQDEINRKSAMALGDKKYISVTTCKRGHVGLRYIAGGTCCECGTARSSQQYRETPDIIKARSKKFRQDNPDAVAAFMAEYRKANRERLNARDRDRYRENSDDIKAKVAAWQKANPDKRSVQSKRDREKHRERRKQANKSWAIRNPGKCASYVRSRQARKRLAEPTWLSAEHKEAIRALYIKAQSDGKQVDHIVPLKGKTVCGLHVPWNLQLLTQSQNYSKGNRYGD